MIDKEKVTNSNLSGHTQVLEESDNFISPKTFFSSNRSVTCISHLAKSNPKNKDGISDGCGPPNGLTRKNKDRIFETW